MSNALPVLAVSLVDQLGATLVIGLLVGAVYALVALGIVLVYRASGIFNFAQGEFGTVAVFATYVFVVYWRWPYVLGLLGGLAAAVLMGLATERLIIRPLRNSPRVTLLVATAGVALVAIGIEFWRFNEQPIRVLPPISTGLGRVTVFSLQISDQQLITLAVLVAVAIGLIAFFRSPTGLAVLGASQEPTAAELVGVSVRRVSLLTWGLAALLGGLAGVLFAPAAGTFTAAFLSFGPSRALLPGFTAAVLAGMRSMPGAVLGGLAVGVIEALGGLSWFAAVPGARSTVLLAFLLAVLLVRPGGLFVRRAVVAA